MNVGFKVFVDDKWVAGGSCADLASASAEALHYARIYQAEGEVSVKIGRYPKTIVEYFAGRTLEDEEKSPATTPSGQQS